ncbi:hypothetical protein [Streptomyces olivochromogenes]|uniref:hypothetical protein n=1 Tax=Streptomyces olivochromogenes TaxID=1963 RepID=UPI00368C45A6
MVFEAPETLRAQGVTALFEHRLERPTPPAVRREATRAATERNSAAAPGAQRPWQER